MDKYLCSGSMDPAFVARSLETRLPFWREVNPRDCEVFEEARSKIQPFSAPEHVHSLSSRWLSHFGERSATKKSRYDLPSVELSEVEISLIQRSAEQIILDMRLPAVICYSAWSSNSLAKMLPTGRKYRELKVWAYNIAIFENTPGGTKEWYFMIEAKGLSLALSGELAS